MADTALRQGFQGTLRQPHCRSREFSGGGQEGMTDFAVSADTRGRHTAAMPLSRAGAPMESPLCKAALHFQSKLESSQWLPPEQHLERQLRHLGDLIRHARRFVPFYRDVLRDLAVPESGPVAPGLLRAIPVVSRRQVQEAPERFRAGNIPDGHGKSREIFTSGSTGTPLSVRCTEFTNAMQNALSLRSYLWHGFRFGGSLAIIRWFPNEQAAPPGVSAARWSTAGAIPFPTGPSHMLSIKTSVQEQADWLLRANPDYLIAFPTALFGILQEFRARGRTPERLKGIQTFGETVTTECRAAVREMLGFELQDIYSSQEMGIMATQCADHPVYHVQSESVLLEVLDESDSPVADGETGRVVVTNLHNYATPILRYDHGDYATAGGPCACGRGLPVLTEILGRIRNLFVLPDGRTYWPVSNARYFHEVAPIRQYRIIQTSVRDLEVELVCSEPVDEHQQAELIRLVQHAQPAPFHVHLRFVEDIPRTAGGKYEEFICRVPAGTDPAKRVEPSSSPGPA